MRLRRLGGVAGLALLVVVFSAPAGLVQAAFFWHTEIVADNATGLNVSMALDSAGRPHISYLDGGDDNLKYARRDGGGWHIQTVDTSGSIESTAIALDDSDRPHISYYDDDTTALKYTYFDGADWLFMVADGAVDVGWLPALVLDGDELPHIAYIDIENRDVKYTYLTVNAPPTVEAGDPYSGVEGSPITLQATVTDPESDELTTAWSYTITSADPGTTCAFGEASQVDTTFSCTDDGTFTVTLTADDGLNPAVTDSATVTISNAPPTITGSSSTLSGSQVTVTVIATDPGQNDVLSYAFDCNADDTYEIGPQPGNSATCIFGGNVEGTFQIGVQVSDDNGGVTTDSVTVSIPTLMCANIYTAVLRYSADCRDYETAIILPDDDPVTVCANIYTGLLRALATSACARYEISYVLPEDGPLKVCVNSYTQTMRVVDDLGQCTTHEFGRVIAATEVVDSGPPPR